MEEKMITQQELERIIKKNSAKYLKKLEEKQAEADRYKEALTNIGETVVSRGEDDTVVESTNAMPQPTSDEEVIKTVDDILNTPKDMRSNEDEAKLEDLKEAYGHALFNRDLNDARQWAADNYDGDISEVLRDERFLEFAENLNGSVADLLKKYIALTVPKKEKVPPIKTPGSVKDVSGVVAKQYFSKEEVEKMTPAQLKKYLPVIEKSMSKW